MIRQLIKQRRRQILIDINTQKNYFFAEGEECIRNHRRTLGNIRRVMAWARYRHIPVISICEDYSNGQSESKHNSDNPVCSEKIRYTTLSSKVSFPAENNTDLPRDILKSYRQIVFHKRSTDPFDEPRIDRLLSELRNTEFILIGATAEDAVKATALGLLQRGKKISVVVDSVGCHNNKEAKLALRKMAAKGAKLIETKKLAGTSTLKHVVICNCKNCRQKTAKIPAHSVN
jgi:nicotinamidase-related amidase